MNKNLHNAKENKNDEFYTQLEDIEKELKHYKSHFKDKVVYCNCDDPEWSNFFKYFKLNFHHFGLKKLITTHFERKKPSYKLECIQDPDNKEELLITQTALTQNGDFRSDECIDILKEADIIVTNPPFSLFREYITLLMKHNKKFLIIGNNNAITYKEVFKFILSNSVWLGVNSNKTFEFELSPSYTKWNRVDEKTGKKYGKVPAISWFTNLPHKKRNEKIILYHTYTGNEAKYPTYDNYNAIEVSKVSEIPVDYNGYMGVPITFLDKYNPEQFEIIGIANDKRDPDSIFIKGKETYLDEKHKRFVGTVLNGKATYARIIIKRK